MKNPALRTFYALILLLTMIISLSACQQTAADSSDQSIDDDVSTATNGEPDSSTDEVEPEPPEANFLVEPKARIKGGEDKSWHDTMVVKNGDTVEIQIQYANLDTVPHYNVALIVTLPDEVEFISGSTVLYNADNLEGKPIEEDHLITEGIMIGSYNGYTPAEDPQDTAGSDSSADDGNSSTPPNSTPFGANAYVRFTIKINEIDPAVFNLPIIIKMDVTRADREESTMTCDFFYLDVDVPPSV